MGRRAIVLALAALCVPGEAAGGVHMMNAKEAKHSILHDHMRSSGHFSKAKVCHIVRSWCYTARICVPPLGVQSTFTPVPRPTP